jgi:hypothetical protein
LVPAAASGDLNELAEAKLLGPVRTIFGTTISQRPLTSGSGLCAAAGIPRAARASACDCGGFAKSRPVVSRSWSWAVKEDHVMVK